MPPFADRVSAGRALAERLAARAYDDPVVLALPRGGVPVAAEVARRIGAPLDLVMVRKIGVPYHSELAAAAVVNGDRPEIAMNERIMRASGLTEADIESLARPQLDEIKRRRTIYFGDVAPQDIAGRTAIVVDDGIATGATMRAALLALRKKNPQRLVLAVPVAPPDSLELLEPEVDEIVCLNTPASFVAVGAHYADFPQVSDGEVVALLEAHRNAPMTGSDPEVEADHG